MDLSVSKKNSLYNFFYFKPWDKLEFVNALIWIRFYCLWYLRKSFFVLLTQFLSLGIFSSTYCCL